MSDLLPGSPPLRPSYPLPYHDGDGRTDGVPTRTDLKQLLMVLRRRIGVVASVAAVTVFLVSMFVIWERPLYRSTATMQLAHPRRALTVGVEDLPAAKEPGSDPLLSLVELVRGRAVVGAVVDSLGLRLQPLGSFSWWSGPSSRALRAALRDVQVKPEAQEDTLRVSFGRDGVIVRGLREEARSPYGSPLTVGLVRFTIPSSPGKQTGTLVVRSREQAIDDVSKILAVVRRKSTDILDITYSDHDPHLAQRVVNLLVRAFQTSNAGSAQGQARLRAEFLAAQLATTDSQIVEAEAQLSAFRSKRLLASSGDMLAGEQARLTSLDTRSGELEAGRKVYQTFLDKLNTASDRTRLEVLRDLSFTPELAADPVVGRVSQQVLIYQTRLDSLTTGPLPAAATNPDVVQLKALINSTQEELARALRAHLASIDAQRQALAALRIRTGSSIQQLPATKAEEMRLEREVEAMRTTGDQVRQEYERARMAEAISAGDAQVVDWAPLPYKPAGIPPWAKLGLGVLLGLMLGAGAAGVAESMNTSIMRPEELERVLNLRDLGVIPPLPSVAATGNRWQKLLGRLPEGDKGGQNLGWEVVPNSPLLSVGAEAFRLLHTGLMFGWGQRHRTILVTSVAPQEGKTLIAANLAVTFAREGARVLLVDLDVLRPRLHKVFGLPRAPGLIDLLKSNGTALARSSEVTLEVGDAVVKRPIPGILSTEVPGLSLLPCGGLPPDAKEVERLHPLVLAWARGHSRTRAMRIGRPTLETDQLRSLLGGLSSDFDVIILDTPPVLVSADATRLAPLADGCILVVRAGQTNRANAGRAISYLTAAGANLLGAVLNDPAGELSHYGELYYSYDYPVQSD
jgi:polysaccharide biosynthesis transport protein